MIPYHEADGITIYHADCRDILPVTAADCVVTDPPFKLSQTYASNVDADNLNAVASLKDAAADLLLCVQPGGTALVFYDNRIMPFGLDAFTRAGWKYERMIAFYRRWGNAHQLAGWMSTTDPVLLFSKPGARPTFYGSWRHDCYVKDRAEAMTAGHPAQKPVEVLSHMVERLCPPGGTVIDPYMGSGSVLVAARRMGRKAIGIEVEERYCEIAVSRMGQAALDLGGAA